MNNGINPENQNSFETESANQATESNFNQYQEPAPEQPNPGYAPYQQPVQPQYQQGFYQQPNYVDESGLFSENKMARINGTSANVKLGDWMKADCLSFLFLIPCIGPIAYIVIYCILAFSSKTNKSMKTRYQAYLIWSAIFFGIYILVFVLAFVFAGGFINEILENVGGEF